MIARYSIPQRALRLVALVVWLLAAALAAGPASATTNIQSVTSARGVTAWLVEDYAVPIVAIRFAFTGGTSQDPQGKEGLVNLMTGLFDEGAGPLDSDTFQERLDDVGAEMRFTANADSLEGSMRMLAERRDEAFELLRLAVNEPRFDPGPVERIRAQIISSIKASERDPGAIADKAWKHMIYGDHPYGRVTEGTEQSVRAVAPEDLRAAHAALFARANLHVAVVGAIDAESLKPILDKVFGALREQPDIAPVGDIAPRLGETLHVAYDLPQTSIRMAYPGVARKAPEFFAAYVMNHILGGGTFSSRLFDEVREKRGLVYGIGSYLVSRDHSASLFIGTSTQAERAGETIAVIHDVIARMAAEGPGAGELADAKRYIIGAYAISNLDSSSAIAATLLGLQMEDLGIDYIERREALINAVTLDEVRAQARALLSVKPGIMLVGPDAGKPGTR